MPRNYRAEYEARKARAQAAGFSGYGQQRRTQDRQIEDILANDPIFGGLPAEQRTRANAVLYRRGFLYTGPGNKQQRAVRKKLLKKLEGNLDIGVWTDYYKDVIYPRLTGQQYPNWQPIVPQVMPITMDEWEEMMRANRIDEGEE